MEERRFDDIARSLGSTTSRRSALKVLAGTAAGGFLGLFGSRSASAKPPAHAGKPQGVPPANPGPPHTQCPTDCCPADHPTLCGLTCVDTASDSNNCGACGVSCGAGQQCREGACVAVEQPGECEPGSTESCGSSIGICQPGVRTCQLDGTWGPCEGGTGPEPEVCDGLDNDCDGVVDNVDPALLLADPNNCGECFNVCPSNSVCDQGTCGCLTGFTNCNGQCVDHLTDRNHCGSCGAHCGPGQTCEQGQCVDIHCTTAADCDVDRDCVVPDCLDGVCVVYEQPNDTECPGGKCQNGICEESS